MLTTQIGSLPFLDISSAIDYAIQFDLPFIPSLPQFDKSEMMMALAMDGYLKMDISIKEKCLIPMLEKYRPARCKYQILGPVSALIIHKRNIDKKKLHEYLLLKLSEVIKVFKKYNSRPVIFLDEPCLEFANDADYRDLKAFLKKLITMVGLDLSKEQVGLHCCSNANWSLLADLPVQYLSFDYVRYHQSVDKHIDKLKSKVLCFGVLPTDLSTTSETSEASKNIVNLSKKLLKQIEIYSHKYCLAENSQLYLTPTCGLAMSSVALANQALNIKDFKETFLL